MAKAAAPLIPDLFDDALAPVPAPAISSSKESVRLKTEAAAAGLPSTGYSAKDI